MHATLYLAKKTNDRPPAVAVMFGEETHLKQLCLARLAELVLGTGPDAAVGLVKFPGKETELKTVKAELQTVGMFASSRLVVVEDADDFVTKYRDLLEAYCLKPASRSVLVIDCKSWKSNTRLAKKIAESGLELDCGELAAGPLQKWIVDYTAAEHGKQINRDSASLLVELAGTGLGQLSQELAKLASFVGDRPQIKPDDVRQLVGGWRAEETWTMTNAVRDGNPELALTCLSKLLHAGEAAPKILGGLIYVFKKFAIATEISRRKIPLPVALKEAGVFPRDLDSSERYLKRLGRARADQLFARLADADRDLKGGSRMPDRLQLESLLLWLSGQLG
ncbi:MAG: DNA polymerase III subunit delta [Planctomycetaceae bacterium]